MSSDSAPADQRSGGTTTVSPHATVSGQSPQAKASSVAPDTAVITIDGICDNSSGEKTVGSKCKTVITRTQFEKVIEAVQPNMPARARREFALRYVNALVMTMMAEQMGLDKGAKYEEQMKFARIQVLSKELNKAIEEKVLRISDRDIEEYYKNNMARFEKADLDRVYVPKTRHAHAVSDQQRSDPDRRERSHESEETMKEEADNLYARAVAGEEFTKLQSDAYRVAGINITGSNTTIKITRTSLPPNQASVMDLKPGEVSSILAEEGGYVIYKVKAKDTLPLDQAREEIKATLRSERLQEEMRSIQDSATPTLDERYFRPVRPSQGMPKAAEPAKAMSDSYPNSRQ